MPFLNDKIRLNNAYYLRYLDNLMRVVIYQIGIRQKGQKPFTKKTFPYLLHEA